MDTQQHAIHTGATNTPILENFEKLCHVLPHIPVVARTPVVPDATDSEENIGAIVEFLRGRPNVQNHELLAYHRFGEPKYRQLGREYLMKGVERPIQEKMEMLNRICGDAVKKEKSRSTGR
jgi:pyruvate formate lyase activating enzyme